MLFGGCDLQGLYLGCTRDMLLFLIAVTWIPWGVLSGERVAHDN